LLTVEKEKLKTDGTSHNNYYYFCLSNVAVVHKTDTRQTDCTRKIGDKKDRTVEKKKREFVERFKLHVTVMEFQKEKKTKG
jgi:hypothetical protein